MSGMEESIFKRLTSNKDIPLSPPGAADDGVYAPDPTLRDGQLLRKELVAQLPPELIGIPLEELDPYYYKNQDQKQTFLVIEKDGSINRFSFTDAFNSLSPFSPVRHANIFLMTNWIFKKFMIFVVLMDILNQASVANLGDFYGEYIFIALYVFQFTVNLIARGFVMDQFSCLRMFWNWVDVLIIFTFPAIPLSLVSRSYSTAAGLASALRMLRIIPLDSGLRLEAEFLATSCRGMFEFLILTPMTIFVFALASMQFYMGALRNKCLLKPSGGLNNTNSPEYISYASNPENWLKKTNTPDYELCQLFTGDSCPEGWTCIYGYGPNPAYDLTSFDNLYTAYLSVTRLVTLDFWENLFQQLVATVGATSTINLLLIFFFATFPIGTMAFAFLGSIFLNSKRELTTGIVADTEEIPEEDDNEPQSFYSCSRWCLSWTVFHRLKPMLPYLDLVVGFANVYDIITLCLYHHGIEQWVVAIKFLKISDIVVYSVYVAEFLSKFIILSPKTYFKAEWSTFDFWLVLFWTLFMALSMVNLPGGSLILFVVLMMRVMKLVRRLPTVKLLYKIIGNSLKTFINLFAIMALFIIIFALIGMHLHQNDFHNSSSYLRGGEMPRWNLIDFSHAYMHVFRTLCGEWIETAWDVVYISGPQAIIYVGATLIVGNFLLLNLSVGIILNAVEILTIEEKKQRRGKSSTVDKICELICLPYTWINDKVNPPESDKIGDDVVGGDLEILHSAASTRHQTDANILDWRNYFQFSTSLIFLQVSIIAVIISILVLIIGSSNLEFIFYENLVFVIYFSLELILRLVSGGFRKSVHSGWIFDLVIVVNALVTICVPSEHSPGQHGFLYLQCLRPFMLFSRVQGLQAVAKGVLKEISLVWKYILALFFLWLVYGIPTIGGFSGKFFKCVDNESNRPDYRIINTRHDCEAANYTWENSEFNFDHIGNTFLSLFSLASIQGWIAIHADVVDSRGIDEQPVREVNFVIFTFFIGFIVFGVFIPFNILFGVLAHHLNKPSIFGTFMTEAQKGSYVHLEHTASSSDSTGQEASIPRPNAMCGRVCYDLVSNIKFETFVVVVICIDLLLLAIEHVGMSEKMGLAFQTFRLVILSIYLVECIVKISAWKLHYFKNWINILDFLVVLDGAIMAVIIEIGSNAFQFMLRPFRIVRILTYSPVSSQLVKIKKYGRGLRLAKSSLFNLLMMLTTLWTTFSLLGNALFGHLPIQGFDPLVNFKWVGSSFLVTLQLFFFSGWDSIYNGFLQAKHYDNETDECTNCHYSWIGLIFILISTVTSIILMSNMYIVLILEVIKQLKAPEKKIGEDVPDVVTTARANDENRLEPAQELRDSTDDISL